MVESVSTVLPNSTSDWIADATSIVSSGITGAAGGYRSALETFPPQTIIRMNQITSSLGTAAKFTKGAGIVGGVVSFGATAYSIYDTYKNTGEFDGRAAGYEFAKTGVELAIGYYAGAATVAVTGIAAAPVVAVGVGIIAAVAAGALVTAAFNYLTSDEGKVFTDYADGLFGDAANYFDSIFPVVLDLDGDGVELVNVDQSSVFFDIDGDGFIENTGWAGADDGLLVIDLAADGTAGPDGQVTSADEFVFTRHAPGATSDLEALSLAFDSNHDGILNSDDLRWGEFRIWQDVNQDGVSDAGELKTLAELGMTSLNLNGVPYVPATGSEPGPKENEISSMSSYTKADGTTGSLADVAFKYSVYGYQWTDNASGGVLLDAENGNDVIYLNDGTDHVMDVMALGYVGAFGGDGADQLSSGGDAVMFADTLLDGGAGNDVLVGGYGDDWLSGGNGADSLQGGAGHDVLFIDAQDTLIDGGADYDVAIVADVNGIVLDAGAANLEAVYGNDGADVLFSSGSTSVHLDGAAGGDVLTGGSGNDLLDGGLGADSLVGGAGDDTLFIDSSDTLIDGGYGYDVAYISTEVGVTLDAGAAGLEAVFGNAGDDHLSTSGAAGVMLAGGAGNDTVIGGIGDDVLISGLGDDSVDGGAGSDTVTFLGLFHDYEITQNANGSYTVIDNKPELWGDEGVDQLTGVERLQFADRTIYLDGTANRPIADVWDWSKTYKDTAVLITSAELLANDGNFNGSGLALTEVGNARHGTVGQDANGNVVFVPEAGFTGRARFDYIVADPNTGAQTTSSAYVNVLGALPTDTYFQSQWHLDAINAPETWGDYTGAGVRVGIFDQGVDYTHQDIDGNYNTAIDYDFYGNDADPFTTQVDEGHGTMLAGVIAAERNGEGIVGVAYNSEVAVMRGSVSLGSWLWTQKHDWIAAYKNFDVVNNSWSMTTPFGANFLANSWEAGVETRFQDAVSQGRGGLGTVIVFSGGNNRAQGWNSNYSNYKNSRYTIAVGAVGQDERYSFYSAPGANLLITAPGDNIYSTNAQQPYGYGALDADYISTNGTSSSAPIVTGIVALILDANSNLGYRDVQSILALSARQVDSSGGSWAYDAVGAYVNKGAWEWNGAANWNGGGMHTSHDYGFGMVDARGAVRLAETWEKQSTCGNELSVAASGTPAAIIPDQGRLECTLQMVSSLSLEHVEVEVDITHPHIGDLVITLISPDGTKSVLMDRPGRTPSLHELDGVKDGGQFSGEAYVGLYQDNLHYCFTTTNCWGETGNGVWTLRVEDAMGLDVGVLNSWNITLYGGATTTDDTYFYTDEYATLTARSDTLRRVLTDTDGGVDAINAATVRGDMLIDLNSGASSWIAENSLVIDANTLIENVYAGDGDDWLVGNALANKLVGGRGDDIIAGGAGADVLDGGSGYDTLSYGGSVAGVSINLSTGIVSGGDAQGDVITAFEAVTGSSFGDTLAGDGGNNTLSGQGGDDVLSGLDGNDTLQGDVGLDTLLGGTGNDTLVGGAGADILDGGAGVDTASYASSTVAVNVNLLTNVAMGGEAEGDTLTGVENLEGSSLGDVLTGDIENNLLDGGAGDDMLNGGSGNDVIDGGSGNDGVEFLGNSTDYAVTSDGTTITVTDNNFLDGNEGIDTFVNVENLKFADKTFTVTGAAVNPIVGADSASGLEDASITILASLLLANDLGIHGNALSLNSVNNAINGSVTLDVNGNVVFTPTANFNGTATFDYVVNDGFGGASTSTVSVNVVAPVNYAPVADAGTIETNKDTHVSGLVTASDIDGDVLHYQLETGAVNGSVQLYADGTYTYIPNANYTGSDSFTFLAIDTAGAGATGTVNVTVNPGGSYESSLSMAGEEFRVNTMTNSYNNQPVLASLPGNGFVVVGLDRAADGSGSGVYGQRYDMNGNKDGVEFRVNTYTASDQTYPSVTGLSDGGFVVTWASSQQDGSGYGIYGQRYTAAGLTVGGEFLINSYTISNQFDPSVTALTDGGFVVAWSSYQDGSDNGVYGQRYDANGVKSSVEFQINTYTTNSQSFSNVIGLADGGFVVSWTSILQDGSSYGVYGQKYDANGIKSGSEFQINTYATNAQFRSAIASLGDGGFVVTWDSFQQDGSLYGVYAQRYDANGNAVGSEFQVNTCTNSYQMNPSIAGLPNGNFLITWESNGQNGNGWGIYGQLFSADGTPIGGEVQVSSIPSTNQQSSSVIALDDGRLVVGWGSNAQGGAFDYGVYAQLFELTQLITDGGTGYDQLMGNDNANILTGDAGNDVLDARGGHDVLMGGTGDDILIGGLGNDLLNGGSGNDVIDGGSGNDVVEFLGNSTDYAVTSDGMTITVIDNNLLDGNEGIDTFVNVENLKFADKTFTVTGAAVNPIVGADSASGLEDASITILASLLLANDLGIHGNALSLNSVNNAINGSVTLDVNGNVVFTPTANFNGTATFDYVVNDGFGGASTSTVSVNVAPVNDAPVADVSAAETQEATAVSGVVTASDIDGDVLHYHLETGAVNGSVQLYADGTYTYTPNPYYTGADSFTFRGVDPSGLNSFGTVNVVVKPAGTIPNGAVVAELVGGGTVVVWAGAGSSSSVYYGYGLFGQKYDVTGNPTGPEFQIDSDYAGSFGQLSPSVAGLSDGGFVVSWGGSATYGSGVYIFGKKYDANAMPSGYTFSVNSYSINSLTTITPLTTGLTNGGFVVTWPADGYIFVQAYDANSMAVGYAAPANSYLTSGDKPYSVVNMPSGEFIVTWVDQGLNNLGQIYGADGMRLGGQLYFDASHTYNPFPVDLHANFSDGRQVVGWATDAQSGGFDVHAQIINSSSGDDHLVGSYGADTLMGGLGNDVLNGQGGNDILNGGTGNDTLFGGFGNETYQFSRGDGQDLIVNIGDGADHSYDSISYTSGVNHDQLWFSQKGNDLIVQVIGTTDKATVSNWYISTNNQVANISTSDGYFLANTLVQNLVTAMAGMTPPPVGQTNLSTTQQTQLGSVIAANWLS